MLSRNGNQSSAPEWCVDVFAAAGNGDTSEILASAASVFARWPTGEKYQALKKAAGKSLLIFHFAFFTFMSDSIADMLNRIKTSQAVLKPTVTLPFSNLKYELGKILEKQGFIEKIEKKGRKNKRVIFITLKYNNGQPAIQGLKRVSKSGQRIYLPVKNIKSVRGGYGLAIISTPKGLMTDKEARKQRVGGEVMCEVW